MIRVLLHAKKCVLAETLWAAMKVREGVDPFALTNTEEALFREMELRHPDTVLLMPEVSEAGVCDCEVIANDRQGDRANTG